MILYKYTDNTYILKEVTKKINIDDLNLLINEILKEVKELDRNSKVNRAMRQKDEYIVICGYASLTQNKLENLIKIFLNEYKIDFTIETITDEIIDYLKDVLPIRSLRKGSQCGGVNNDARSLDPNIKPLVDVINLYDGITTFSSCEGHIKNNSGTLYVLFTSDSMDNLSKFTYDLWFSLEELSKKYSDIPVFDLMFDYGHWPNIQSVYFEMRLNYQKYQQELVFEAVNYLSSLLRKGDTKN